jgi:hypothetical protein
MFVFCLDGHRWVLVPPETLYSILKHIWKVELIALVREVNVVDLNLLRGHHKLIQCQRVKFLNCLISGVEDVDIAHFSRRHDVLVN